MSKYSKFCGMLNLVFCDIQNNILDLCFSVLQSMWVTSMNFLLQFLPEMQITLKTRE